MTNDSTTAATPATISESELFAEFVKHGFAVHSQFTGKPLVYEMPLNFISDGGIYGSLEGVTELIADIILDVDNPRETLKHMIEDVEGYVNSLRFVQEAFEALCYRRNADPDREDDDEATRYTPRGEDEHGSPEFWSNISAEEDDDA